MSDVIIGIDPDIERDGVAILYPATRSISVQATPFGKTLSLLQAASINAMASGESLTVIIEAGWVHKSNFHLRLSDSKPVIARKGVDQGRNHQRGIDIAEYCKYNNIPYQLQAPLRKVWKGHDRKITQVEIESFMGKLRTTGKGGRVAMPNQEMRDAALLPWTAANLPIRL